jgi:hypothetical protein
MRGGVLKQGFSRFGEAVCGEAVRNDQDTVVAASLVIELQRKSNEIVTVPGYEAALFQSSAFELLKVRQSFCPDLMDADGIEPLAPEPFRDSLAQIFIKIISQCSQSDPSSSEKRMAACSKRSQRRGARKINERRRTKRKYVVAR